MHTELWDGPKTQFIGDQCWETEDNGEDDDIAWSIEYLHTLDEREVFKEKLAERMTAAGYQGDIHDQAAAVAFLNKCCKNAGVSILTHNLKHWVSAGTVSTDQRGRTNIYKLCFALKMTAAETRTFFHKALLTRPFNFKDLHEAVCFFCLNTHKSYQDVERLVTKIQQTPPKEAAGTIAHTELIGRSIALCKTEDELIDYWARNSAGFTQHRQTATEEFKALLLRCYSAAEKCFGRKYRNPDELLGALFGFNARAVKEGKKLYSKAISESDLPPAVKRNFPQRQQIEQIQKNKASDDVLRKALVALSFFEFYTSDPEGEFDEFIDLLNTRLEKCGYIRFYFRNPYDWLFLHCATFDDPLNVLQKMVEKAVTRTDRKRLFPINM